jgi:hypothetical protein
MPAVKKEQLEEAAKQALPPLEEIGRKDLLRDDAVYFIGLMAAKGLAAFGQVTLIMGSDDKVCIANPTQVYLDVGAVINDDSDPALLPKFKWVRPILGSGRPQYVAYRDGELWEIEFVDESEDESEEESGSRSHQ